MEGFTGSQVHKQRCEHVLAPFFIYTLFFAFLSHFQVIVQLLILHRQAQNVVFKFWLRVKSYPNLPGLESKNWSSMEEHWCLRSWTCWYIWDCVVLLRNPSMLEPYVTKVFLQDLRVGSRIPFSIQILNHPSSPLPLPPHALTVMFCLWNAVFVFSFSNRAR